MNRSLWTALRLDQSRVLIRAGQTKTKRWRIVPLPACAVAWLRTVACADGPIWPDKEHKFHIDACAPAVRCELNWRPNALRNSAVTHDQIANPDTVRVACEAGNSPGVLETEYFALNGITKAMAEAWFNILPPAQIRVIVLMAVE